MRRSQRVLRFSGWSHFPRSWSLRLRSRRTFATVADASPSYDVIVIGGGHAGAEASAGASRAGARTALVTPSLSNLGVCSCNPSFGGIGKGTLIREIDALDGLAGRIVDKAGVQFRVLNKAKGPAVWGPRAQIDRNLYKQHMRDELVNYDTKQHSQGKRRGQLAVVEGKVADIILDRASDSSEGRKGKITGVRLESGEILPTSQVVITTGTFLGGEIHIGLTTYPAGRLGEAATTGLSSSLRDAGFTLGRLKTGTPPRIDGKTVDFSKTIPQSGDDPPLPFSYLSLDGVTVKDQLHCQATHTTPKTHDIVRQYLDQSIHIRESVRGPRYCPSLESKVIRFGHKEQHLVWLEPEGFDTDVMYPNGLSMTVPPEAQEAILRSIPGMENVKMLQPGYGVEYWFSSPLSLRRTLETKPIAGLFLAGQINGTTGYEEAAAQGVVAGINAGLASQARTQIALSRADGYIGILIDDLVTRGITEPYRMFTSRSEFRLSARVDNADTRLTPIGRAAGVISDERWNLFTQTRDQIDELRTKLQKKSFKPEDVPSAHFRGPSRIAFDVLRMNGVTTDTILPAFPELDNYDPGIRDRVEIEAKYAPYVERQESTMRSLLRDEGIPIPLDLDFEGVVGLSFEEREALQRSRPENLGQARRVEGVSASGIVRLLGYLRGQRKLARTEQMVPPERAIDFGQTLGA